jgi:hypothetical protein
MAGEAHGERLTPGQEFINTLDGHFDGVGGHGTTEGRRPGEEAVPLIFIEADGLLGGFPRSAFAKRSIRGQENLAAAFWPETHGHCLETYAAPTAQISLFIKYFVEGGDIWVARNKWHAGVPVAPLFTPPGEGRPTRLSDEKVPRFLRSLLQAVPVMPETPDPRET